MTVTFDFSNTPKDISSLILAMVDAVTPQLMHLTNDHGIIGMFTTIPETTYSALAKMMNYIDNGEVCINDIAHSIINYDFDVVY